jgi:sigma-E factor negative regulatory protein RseC
MEASVCIEQKGVVEEITNHTARVRIHREAMCGKCSARGICNLTDATERIIEINRITPELKTGDPVLVKITRSMGNKALLLGYFVPFIVLIASLVLLSTTIRYEWVTGTLSIVIVIIYYFTLYLFRDRLRKTFTFHIRKTD